ncbi:MAG: OmpH family outer membrane protein [Gemmatimonadota bacterium]
MKRIVSVALLAVLAVVGGGQRAQAQQNGSKIAFVNTQLILKDTPGFAQAESLFTREVDGYRAEAARLQTTLDSAASAFTRDQVLLSPSAREAKRKELETSQQAMETRMTELRDLANRRQDELLNPITARIQTVIDGLRAEGNYAMIFDIATLGSGVISADRSLDLTQTVIQRLQASR